MGRPLNLLVVDWDSFFRNPLEAHDEQEGDRRVLGLYDWGHREAPFFLGPIWTIRASAFLLAGLPLPGTTGNEEGFWKRFRFSPKAGLFAAESNAWAAAPEIVGSSRWKSVWLFDAHHDAGYRPESLGRIAANGSYSCEDWMLIYGIYMRSRLHVRYPPWRAVDQEPKPLVDVDRRIDNWRHLPLAVTFDRVFVCRSGAWVPPWLDEAFERFLADCPVGPAMWLGDHKGPRAFDLAEAEAMAVRSKSVFANR